MRPAGILVVENCKQTCIKIAGCTGIVTFTMPLTNHKMCFLTGSWCGKIHLRGENSDYYQRSWFCPTTGSDHGSLVIWSISYRIVHEYKVS